MDPASDSIPRTGNPIFTSLPREIRVCIYKAAFDTNGNLNSDVDTFQLFTVGKSKLTPFAVIAHKWAARSRVAREACITFYEHKMFDLNAKAIQDLIPDSFARTVAQQLNILGCKNFTSFQDIDKPLSLSIEPRPYLRNLHIYLMDRNYDPWSDLRLPALSELLRCPNLKYVSIRIWAFDVVNPFPEALPAIQLISEVCKTLKEKIGGNKENPWPRFSSRFSSSARGLNDDATWMWDQPGEEIEARVKDGTATAEEQFRLLIAKGHEEGGEELFLEQMRDVANCFIPNNVPEKYT